ncbi:MAG TPA: c-type cytochrome [Planctomycetota bacterium]|jgi:mono/diheme cytochrome c family protein
MARFAGAVWLGISLVGAIMAGEQTPWVAPARAAKKANPIAADAQSMARGKQLFTKNCLSCHGETGRGDGPAAKDLERHPGNLSDPKMFEQSDGALFWKITEGNKPMLSFEKTLTPEERWDVVNYVRTLAKKP